MRIALAHSHLNTLGGGERVTLELMRQLSRRHDVVLWAGGFRPEDTYADLARFPRRDLARWEWLVRVPPTDVVIAQTFGANLLALRHPRALCYIHTLRSVYLRRADRPDLLARRALDGAALRRASALVANSAFTAAQVASLYGRRAQVVPCGADADLLQVPDTVGTYALYVGRLAPEKGLERLLAWSADLPIDLAIVGAGAPDYVAHLRGRAGPRVRWLGPLQGAALRQAYAGARLIVFLPYAEEFGLAALEAMAAARPVVTVPEGGLPELVQDGVTGYLVQDQRAFASVIGRLLADDALCAQLGQAGRARARQYTWVAMADRIEALCLELVSQSRSAPARIAAEPERR